MFPTSSSFQDCTPRVPPRQPPNLAHLRTGKELAMSSLCCSGQSLVLMAPSQPPMRGLWGLSRCVCFILAVRVAKGPRVLTRGTQKAKTAQGFKLESFFKPGETLHSRGRSLTTDAARKASVFTHGSASQVRRVTTPESTSCGQAPPRRGFFIFEDRHLAVLHKGRDKTSFEHAVLSWPLAGVLVGAPRAIVSAAKGAQMSPTRSGWHAGERNCTNISGAGKMGFAAGGLAQTGLRTGPKDGGNPTSNLRISMLGPRAVTSSGTNSERKHANCLISLPYQF